MTPRSSSSTLQKKGSVMMMLLLLLVVMGLLLPDNVQSRHATTAVESNHHHPYGIITRRPFSNAPPPLPPLRRRRISSSSLPSTQLVSKTSSTSLSSSSSRQLTVLGTILASTVQVVTTTGINYVTGYVTGYVIGTLIGIPQSVLRRQGTNHHPTPGMMRHIHQTAHAQYGQKWGHVSGVFGGSRTLLTVLRRPFLRMNTGPSFHHNPQLKNDAIHTAAFLEQHEKWNDILSSLLAGAILARSGTYHKLQGGRCGLFFGRCVRVCGRAKSISLSFEPTHKNKYSQSVVFPSWLGRFCRRTTRHATECPIIWWHVVFVFHHDNGIIQNVNSVRHTID